MDEHVPKIARLSVGDTIQILHKEGIIRAFVMSIDFGADDESGMVEFQTIDGFPGRITGWSLELRGILEDDMDEDHETV